MESPFPSVHTRWSIICRSFRVNPSLWLKNALNLYYINNNNNFIFDYFSKFTLSYVTQFSCYFALLLLSLMYYPSLL